MKIDIDSFTGMRPAREPDLLENNEAQTAVGTLMETGGIEGFPADSNLKAATKTGPLTIWRYPASAEVDHWMEFAGRASVVRSPILQDVWDRIYWTESAGMRYGPSAVVLSGASFPGTSYAVGIPAPASAPTISAFTAGVDGSTEARVYLQTFLSTYDEEGPPSAVGASAVVNPNNTVTIDTFGAAPTGDLNINRRRIYRSSYTGSSLAQAQLVTTLPIATSSFVDSVPQTGLGKVLETDAYYPPLADVHSLTMTDSGIAVVAKGRDVFFSENWLPHAFDPTNSQTLQYDVVALAAFEQVVIAMTTGRLYAGAGTTPGGIQLSSLRDSKACLSARGVVVTESGALYPSPDGLISIGTNFKPVEVTKGLITPRQWMELNPASFIATQQAGAYIAFFQKADTTMGILRLDLSGKTAPYVQMLQTTGQPVTAAFYDDAMGAPYVAAGGQIKRFAKGGATKSWKWRSKDFDFRGPRMLAAGFVDGAAGTITFRAYCDGVLKVTKTVTTNRAFLLPSGLRKQTWSFELEGSLKVTRLRVAPSIQELFE